MSAGGVVLVVDDDVMVRDVVGRYLGRAGYHVTVAGDGAEALRAVEATPPDLVILDLMLPGLPGLEVCRRLRAASPVPVVMLTALGEEEDRIAGLELGADVPAWAWPSRGASSRRIPVTLRPAITARAVASRSCSRSPRQPSSERLDDHGVGGQVPTRPAAKRPRTAP
jgi:CheY-like chemotaxis protein